MCVHKYWTVRWKRGLLHSGMGVLTLNAWVTDYFLTSWTSTLYKEEPQPESEGAKLETRAFQIIQNHRLVSVKDLASFKCIQLLFLKFQTLFFFFYFPPCQLNLFPCSMGRRDYRQFHFKTRGDGVRLFPLESDEGWMSEGNSRIKTASLENKKKKLQRKFILRFKTWVSVCEGPFLHKWAHKPQCLFK